ncbi:MAG: PrsW family glutamic-type intramembrane protease [Candidatus Marinimicrobia bacterium]|nr:PrsW family glutamic-type intramembrane protease [Candidatus Neomarinimicrobiota bacterium]MDX9778338.1 PrsW family glutamic-type intramembrane protease [bacterium]
MLKTALEILILSVLPGLLWIIFIYRRDRYEPEPKSMILRAFILGAFCVFPALLLEWLLDFGSDFSMAVLTAPIIEEVLKFLIFMIFFYHHRDFDEPLDGIIYACTIALGFATVENFFYVFSALEYDRIYQVAGLRAFLSIPGHFLFSALWGYAAAVTKFKMRRPVRLGAGLLAAIVLHAAFNLTAIASALGSGLFIAIISLYGWTLFSKRIHDLQKDSKDRNRDDLPD